MLKMTLFVNVGVMKMVKDLVNTFICEKCGKVTDEVTLDYICLECDNNE